MKKIRKWLKRIDFKILLIKNKFPVVQITPEVKYNRKMIREMNKISGGKPIEFPAYMGRRGYEVWFRVFSNRNLDRGYFLRILEFIFGKIEGMGCKVIFGLEDPFVKQNKKFEQNDEQWNERMRKNGCSCVSKDNYDDEETNKRLMS
jgi:hypothetical protein